MRDLASSLGIFGSNKNLGFTHVNTNKVPTTMEGMDLIDMRPSKNKKTWTD